MYIKVQFWVIITYLFYGIYFEWVLVLPAQVAHPKQKINKKNKKDFYLFKLIILMLPELIGWRRREMAIHFPNPPPHASFTAFSNHVYGGAACFPPIPCRRPSLALYCQLSDHQTAPQLAVPSRPITINRSLLSVSATCSEAELWAAACLRVRTFYDFDEQTFGIEVSVML